MCLEASDVFRPVLWEVATLGDSKKLLPFSSIRRAETLQGRVMTIVWSRYRTYHLEAFADGRLCKLRRFGGDMAPLSLSTSAARLTFFAPGLGLLLYASGETQAGLLSLVECSVSEGISSSGRRGVLRGGASSRRESPSP